MRILIAPVLVLALAGPAFASPTDDVRVALMKLSQATSYHMDISAGGKTMQVDIVQPGKMHITMGPTQMIRVGDATWVFVNGHWMTIPAMAAGRAGDAFAAAGAPQQLTAHATRIEVTDLGMKTVDGETLHAYGVTDPDQPQHPSTVYVGGDGLVHRMESVDASGRTDAIKFSGFNSRITIDPPAS
ncbi:MAG TPA: hypothetical protein VMD91_17825 [Candidatus Sulfotelmatobacter sp.]|nr:hypothetical protein [Candidatus Sulfotelmatobacter sp.]